MSFQSTPWQTVGPYYRLGLEPLYRTDIAPAIAQGERVEVQGQVFDGNGVPVSDAVLEIWQADAQGIYAHGEDPRRDDHDPAFDGWGRVPGLRGEPQAPHLVVLVFMRGLLQATGARIYFSDEASNAEDGILALVPAERRHTLVAQAQGKGLYHWDVRMQGPDETVFFAY